MDFAFAKLNRKRFIAFFGQKVGIIEQLYHSNFFPHHTLRERNIRWFAGPLSNVSAGNNIILTMVVIFPWRHDEPWSNIAIVCIRIIS